MVGFDATCLCKIKRVRSLGYLQPVEVSRGGQHAEETGHTRDSCPGFCVAPAKAEGGQLIGWSLVRLRVGCPHRWGWRGNAGREHLRESSPLPSAGAPAQAT